MTTEADQFIPPAAAIGKGRSTQASDSAILVQRASAGGMSGGRRGGHHLPKRRAMLSIGGLVWQSPEPETAEQADFFNAAADRINSQNKTPIE